MKLKIANKLDIRDEDGNYMGCLYRESSNHPYVFVGNSADLDAKALREIADKLDELNAD